MKHDKDYILRSLVRELRWNDDHSYFSGIIAYENLYFVKNLDGTESATVNVEEAPFFFIEGSIFLLIFSNYGVAETSSKKLNQMIGGSVVIRNQFFTPEHIEQFLAQNPFIPKRCTWKELAIPGVDKANLGGSDVTRSPDFARYDDLGEKSYLMIELINDRLTITLSSSGAVGFVSSVTQQQALDFVFNKIMPLIWI